MKVLILLLIIEYSLGLTETYYTNCTSENIINPYTRRCLSFSPPEGYCCYLYDDWDWGNDDADIADIIDADTHNEKIKTNSANVRRLLEIHPDCCIGISKDGYTHLDKVIQELRKYTGNYDLVISCRNKHDRLKPTLFIFLFYSLLLLIC